MMKRAIVFGLLALICFAQNANDGQIVRRFTGPGITLDIDDVYVRKFEDGPNTCYVAIAHVYSGTGASISCVKR